MKAGDQTSVLGYYRIEWQNCISVNMIYPSKKWKNDFEDNSEISTGLPATATVVSQSTGPGAKIVSSLIPNGIATSMVFAGQIAAQGSKEKADIQASGWTTSPMDLEDRALSQTELFSSLKKV